MSDETMLDTATICALIVLVHAIKMTITTATAPAEPVVAKPTYGKTKPLLFSVSLNARPWTGQKGDWVYCNARPAQPATVPRAQGMPKYSVPPKM